jgi:hypothetical protein
MIPAMLVYPAIAVALAAAFALWLPWFRANMNHVLFADVMVKILRAGDRNRAVKLTHAAPHSPFAIAFRAALTAAEPAQAFADQFRAELRTLSARLWLMPIALGAAGVGGFLVLDGDAPQFVLAGPAGAVLLVVHARVIAGRIVKAASIESPRALDALTAP